MPAFGKGSLSALELVDTRLRGVLEQAIEYWDFTVLEGHRGPERQQELFESGASQVSWPNSKHSMSWGC